MEFNPDVWPTHKQGEAVRQLILTLLDKPRTKQELAELCHRSVRQIERHLNRLSSESQVKRQNGLWMLTWTKRHI